jgi:hypothetical protein
MIEDMRLRKLAEKTQSGYLRWVRDFTRFLGRAPDTATAEDLRRYQLHLSEHGTSRISLGPPLGSGLTSHTPDDALRCFRCNLSAVQCCRESSAVGGLPERHVT